MKTKRILVSVVTGALLTGSLLAASGNDQVRSKTKVRATKPTATTTVSRTSNRAVTRNRAIATRRVVTTSGNPREIRGTTGAPVQTRRRRHCHLRRRPIDLERYQHHAGQARRSLCQNRCARHFSILQSLISSPFHPASTHSQLPIILSLPKQCCEPSLAPTFSGI